MAEVGGRPANMAAADHWRTLKFRERLGVGREMYKCMVAINHTQARRGPINVARRATRPTGCRGKCTAAAKSVCR